MFSTGFARYLPTLAVAPEVEPVTVSPVIQPLFAEINNLSFAIVSSAKTVDVAPDVEPVMSLAFREKIHQKYFLHLQVYYLRLNHNCLSD